MQPEMFKQFWIFPENIHSSSKYWASADQIATRTISLCMGFGFFCLMFVTGDEPVMVSVKVFEIVLIQVI